MEIKQVSNADMDDCCSNTLWCVEDSEMIPISIWLIMFHALNDYADIKW